MPNKPTWFDKAALGLALVAVLPASEWLREPHTGWVVAAGLLAGIALAGAWGAAWRARIVAAMIVTLAGALFTGQARVARIAQDWPGEHERRIAGAFQRLAGELRAALESNERLANEAVKWGAGDQAAAFTALRKALPRGGAETAVVILEPTGVPWAWAGRHRLAPEPEGDSLGARFTRFYATLESRRHVAGGRVVVASVLIWADSAVPRPDRSLAARFGATAGVQLRVLPPGSTPPGGDVFDYAEPTTEGDRLFFSLQPVPPEQAVVQRSVVQQSSRWVVLALLLLIAGALLVADSSRDRLLLLAGLVWCALRAPLGAAVGLDDLFSPATFHRSVLRPVTASAGNLLVASAGILLFAIWLWGQRAPRRWWMIALGLLLLLGAPYLVNDLGRGILPPAKGVTTGLWVTWQLTLTVTTSAIIFLAGALLGGDDDRKRGVGGVMAGVALAVTASIVGLLVWQPRLGWPEWYTFLWLPALFLVSRRAPRWAVVAGTALVAGTAAALVTWGAELNGRITAAQRDLARLGSPEDDLATPYLERFGEQVLAGPEPTAASALYVLWRSSLLAGQEYPVRLGLWDPGGIRLVELSLDALDLPASLAAALVKSVDSTTPRAVLPLARVPGLHYVLVQRLPSGRILTAAVGPRTRLIAPARLARLLRPPPEGPPLYDLSLSPPLTPGMVEPAPRWQRTGNEVRNDRLIDFPGGARHVHAVIELRPLPLLLVRGALLVAINVAVIATLWLLATLQVQGVRQRLAVRRLARSYRVRLAVALALFFVVPAAGFTVWGLNRLRSEADRTRDLLITAVLRDAALSSGAILQEPTDYLAEGLTELSDRLEADLVLYSGGRLIAASAPVLADLALVEPLLDARVFRRLALSDELELTRPATTYVAPVRMGYRVAQVGPPGGIGILATLQLSYDWARDQDQREVTFLLLLATLGGLGAAVLGARIAAQALSQPVADLRRSAAAVGQGQPLPAVGTPPAEFEQVFGAFERMAADIRASQSALDSARMRTAAVLANVATSVVALDADGRVVLANNRAREQLGASLDEGSEFGAVLDQRWAPLVNVVTGFLRGEEATMGVEVEVGARLYRLQLARRPGPFGGTVLALDDLTDVTQAARVLAWGEMARQVAHEIKNPLTPIRLGMQHLLRIRRDRPEQLSQALGETTERILSEIDRLDTIARAFSRFGLPGSQAAPLETVDIAATAREVASLYRLTADGSSVEVEGAQPMTVPARRDEVKEVLGNLLDNARNAGAKSVVIRVAPATLVVSDDGSGIPPDLLPRLFQPRFSTTTSGSGLGLAIVRRLVEGWGARVDVQSNSGQGTTVSIRWQ